MNINIILDGVTLPMPDVPFQEIFEGLETTNQTLDGSIYTDFIVPGHTRRSWSLAWAVLSKDDYDAIRAIRDAQYTDEAYPILQIDYYNVYAPVKVGLNQKDIYLDGCRIQGIELTLAEQFAVS